MFGKKKDVSADDDRDFPQRIRQLEAEMDEMQRWNGPRPQSHRHPPAPPPDNEISSLLQTGTIPAPIPYTPEVRWCIYGFGAICGLGLVALSLRGISG